MGAGDPNDLTGDSNPAGDIKADDFQRVASAGSFGLSGYSAGMYNPYATGGYFGQYKMMEKP